MLTGKQRAYLKGLAHSKNPTIQCGKEGVSEAFIMQLKTNLESEELVKISILNNSPIETRELFDMLSETIEGIEFIQAMGSKLTVYKRSEKKPKIEI